jgi:ABC-type glycerol-3-phosphate transport system permease component
MHDGGGGHGGCVGALAPVLVYLLFQRRLIRGLTMGAEK